MVEEGEPVGFRPCAEILGVFDSGRSHHLAECRLIEIAILANVDTREVQADAVE